MSKTTHQHEFTRSKPSATVETCRCGKFRHTENAGPSIEGITMSKTNQIVEQLIKDFAASNNSGERALIQERDSCAIRS